MLVLNNPQENLYGYIYSREHPPPHVHVFLGRKSDRNECEAIINIGDDDNPPSFRQIHGMKDDKAREAWLMVAEKQDMLLEKWREIHGQQEVEPGPTRTGGFARAVRKSKKGRRKR